MAIKDRAKSTKVKIRNNQYKTYGIYGAVVLMFLFGFMGVIGYVNKYKKEVEVLSFNQSMIDRALIEERFMTPLTLAERDYKDGMVKWEERDQYIGKYAAHFIRVEHPVYKDSFAEEQALRTAYLYNLESDEELLTFPYQIAQAGGKLVTPGERLRIRGSYKFKGDPETEDDDKVISDIIFDVVEVQDLLNASNESIVDIIDDANRLPQADRETLMKSQEFINKITPSAILMVVKTKDIKKYVEFQANEDPQYVITLLTRNEELKASELNTGNSLLQILSEVQQQQQQTAGTAEN